MELNDSEQIIRFPAEFPFLALSCIRHVGMQGENLCVWVEAHKDGTVTAVKLRVHGTGHDIDHGWPYIGTAIDPRGFVWHVYGEHIGDDPTA